MPAARPNPASGRHRGRRLTADHHRSRLRNVRRRNATCGSATASMPPCQRPAQEAHPGPSGHAVEPTAGRPSAETDGNDWMRATPRPAESGLRPGCAAAALLGATAPPRVSGILARMRAPRASNQHISCRCGRFRQWTAALPKLPAGGMEPRTCRLRRIRPRVPGFDCARPPRLAGAENGLPRMPGHERRMLPGLQPSPDLHVVTHLGGSARKKRTAPAERSPASGRRWRRSRAAPQAARRGRRRSSARTGPARWRGRGCQVVAGRGQGGQSRTRAGRRTTM